MYQLVLFTHILGAGWLFVLVIGVLYCLAIKRHAIMIQMSRALSILAISQTLTGAGVWLLSPTNTSVLSFCQKLGIYLAIIFTTKFIIAQRLRSSRLATA